VGKAALEGLNGVISVGRGFSGFREINTVTYDSTIVNRNQMVSALKEAGTFKGIKE
jgi:copper chaperone CopZ